MGKDLFRSQPISIQNRWVEGLELQEAVVDGLVEGEKHGRRDEPLNLQIVQAHMPLVQHNEEFCLGQRSEGRV